MTPVILRPHKRRIRRAQHPHDLVPRQRRARPHIDGVCIPGGHGDRFGDGVIVVSVGAEGEAGGVRREGECAVAGEEVIGPGGCLDGLLGQEEFEGAGLV